MHEFTIRNRSFSFSVKISEDQFSILVSDIKLVSLEDAQKFSNTKKAIIVSISNLTRLDEILLDIL